MSERREYRYIGKSPRKVDGMMKVTGQTKYADDLSMPRMLYCKLLRSDVAHARIASIEAPAGIRYSP